MVTEELHKRLREKYSPDGSDLRNLQEYLLKMLVDFDKICKENGIRYWLSSGTCLGAVRHHGFIPWDDDIDVDMMEEDYEKLLSCFKENEDYAIQTPDNDFYYLQGFAKFRDKHSTVTESGGGEDKSYKYHGLYIDIFTLGHNNAPYFVYQRIKQHLCWITRLAKKENPSTLTTRIYKRLKKWHLKTIASVVRRDKISRNGTLRYNAGNCFYKFVFKEADCIETIDMDFEGYRFPVPKGYDGYLTDMFGDYMRLPEESQIAGETHYLSFKLNR